MRIRHETPEQIVLTLTPWAPWIISIIAGTAFLAFAAFNPADMPSWALMIFAMLGIAAPIGFLASHAAIHAIFDRDAGVAAILRKRPIGGTSREIIPLERIEAVEHVTQTDVDNTSFHRIELHLRPTSTGSWDDAQKRRVSLTTGPISITQTDQARRLARWLGVPAL